MITQQCSMIMLLNRHTTRNSNSCSDGSNNKKNATFKTSSARHEPGPKTQDNDVFNDAACPLFVKKTACLATFQLAEVEKSINKEEGPSPYEDLRRPY